MSAEDNVQLSKAAVVPIRAAGASFTQAGARGLSTAVTRTSAGLYVATLSQAIPSATCIRTLTLLSASGVGRIEDTSDTVKTIRTFAVDGTTATDIDFDATFARVEPPV
jgi:hypothetical protein